jgi:tetratricopeptide (TPR) repeat protein
MSSASDTHSEEALAKAQQLKEQGNEAFKQKQFGNALTYYSLALELDPSNATLHLNRAICHGSLGQWVHSKIDAQQALELAGEYYAKAHCRLIMALVRACFEACLLLCSCRCVDSHSLSLFLCFSDRSS